MKAGSAIRNLLESMDGGNERDTVFRHIETKIKAGLFPNDAHLILDVFAIGQLYGDIAKMSSDEIDFFTTFFLAHKREFNFRVDSMVLDAFDCNDIPNDRFLKAIYTLRGELKSSYPLCYKKLQAALTPGMENSDLNLRLMSYAAKEIEAYKSKIQAVNAVAKKHGLEFPLTIDSFIKLTEEDRKTIKTLMAVEPEDIKGDLKKYSENYKEVGIAFNTFRKNNNRLTMNLHALNNQMPEKTHIRLIAPEIHKYIEDTRRVQRPDQILRQKFEKVLGIDTARTFFIDLGLEVNTEEKIIPRHLPVPEERKD
jgi:hypothetical protein